MSDDDDEMADVVPLHPGLDLEDDDRPVASDERHRDHEWCPHRRTQLSAENRRVYCRDCDREVDAYEVLEKLARHPERYMESRRGAERRAEYAQRQLDALLRAERNAKARRRSRFKREDEGAIAVLRALVKAAAEHRHLGHPMNDAYADAYGFLVRYDRERE